MTRPAPGPGWRRDALALALLLLVALALYGHGFLQGRTLYYRDLIYHFFPVSEEVTRRLWMGEFPAWMPMLGSGYPLWASMELPLANPLWAPFIWLSFIPALAITVIGLPVLAGWLTYALGRQWGWTRSASCFAAAAYACSGLLVSLTNIVNYFYPACLLPGLLLAHARLCRRPGARSAAAFWLTAALFIACQRPEFTVMALALLAGLACTETGPDRAKAAGWAVAALALAFLADSVVLLPAWEFYRNSNRAAGLPLAQNLAYSFNPVNTLQLFFPWCFRPLEELGLNYFQGYPNETEYATLYWGLLPWLFLAVPGKPGGRRNLVLWLGLFGAWLLALGRWTPVFPWLVLHAPLAGATRFPIKYFQLVTLCTVLLAGGGWDRAQRAPAAIRRPALAAAILATLLGMLALAGINRPALWQAGLAQLDWRPWMESAGAPLEERAARLQHDLAPAIRPLAAQALFAAGMLLLAGTLLLGGASRNRRLFLLALATLDPLIANWAFLEFAPAGLLYDPPPVVLNLHRPPDGLPSRLFRPFGMGMTARPELLDRRPGAPPLHEQQYRLAHRQLLGNLPVRYGWSPVAPIGSLQPRLSVKELLTTLAPSLSPQRLMQVAGALDVQYLLAEGPTSREQSFFIAAGIPQPSAVDSGAGLVAYANPYLLGRFYFCAQARAVGSYQGALAALASQSLDLARTVILTSPAGPQAVAVAPGSASFGDVSLGNNVASLVVMATAPGWLIHADGWYPGWQAIVDGQSRPVLQANGVARAVKVSTGRHEVQFTYNPPAFWWGLLLTMAALAAAGVLVLWASCVITQP